MQSWHSISRTTHKDRLWHGGWENYELSEAARSLSSGQLPRQLAKAVMDQLLKFGEVRRGRLGLVIQDLTPELAAVLGIEGIHGGAVVRDVEAGSSAEKADIKAGDVVIEFNGTRLRDSSNLRNRVGLVPVGEIVELTLLRDGKRETVRTRLRGAEAVSAHGI